jgi:anti-anti-sigma regulatory factor
MVALAQGLHQNRLGAPVMTIDQTHLPPVETRGYELDEIGGGLKVTLSKQFDTARGIDHWAFTVVKAAPGPYREIRVDCSHFPALSSTIIAGLVHLSDHYGKTGGPVVLLKANQRIHSTFKMMHLDELFQFADD